MTAFDCWVRWHPWWPAWTTEGDGQQDEHRSGHGLTFYTTGKHYSRIQADWKTWNGRD